MIELAEGLWIAPEHVGMVKKVDENSCLLFLVGQSALEGHVLPYSVEDVTQAINDYWDDETDGDDTDGEDE